MDTILAVILRALNWCLSRVNHMLRTFNARRRARIRSNESPAAGASRGNQ
jgi:hypothetical protein